MKFYFQQLGPESDVLKETSSNLTNDKLIDFFFTKVSPIEKISWEQVSNRIFDYLIRSTIDQYQSNDILR